MKPCHLLCRKSACQLDEGKQRCLFDHNMSCGFVCRFGRVSLSQVAVFLVWLELWINPCHVQALQQIGWGGLNQRNSVEGVREAFDYGADGVVLDVQVTADGVAVGLNAPTLDEETDGTGAVGDYTWSELVDVRHNG